MLTTSIGNDKCRRLYTLTTSSAPLIVSLSSSCNTSWLLWLYRINTIDTAGHCIAVGLTQNGFQGSWSHWKYFLNRTTWPHGRNLRHSITRIMHVWGLVIQHTVKCIELNSWNSSSFEFKRNDVNKWIECEQVWVKTSSRLPSHLKVVKWHQTTAILGSRGNSTLSQGAP